VVRLSCARAVAEGRQYSETLTAIGALVEGESAFSDDVARSVVNVMVRNPQPRPTSAARLSERERQISYMMARNMKNRDIAHELNISEKTVKRHLRSIFSRQAP